MITLLLGAVAYPLSAAEAAWLERTIRRRYFDEPSRAITVDESVWACVLLADMLRQELADDEPCEPVELGRFHVEGLLAFVFGPGDVEASPDLRALYEGLLRFRSAGRPDG